VGGVAMGLAMEGLRKPKSPAINLRKNEFQRDTAGKYSPNGEPSIMCTTGFKYKFELDHLQAITATSLIKQNQKLFHKTISCIAAKMYKRNQYKQAV
jgi:hypothetical protein